MKLKYFGSIFGGNLFTHHNNAVFHYTRVLLECNSQKKPGFTVYSFSLRVNELTCYAVIKYSPASSKTIIVWLLEIKCDWVKWQNFIPHGLVAQLGRDVINCSDMESTEQLILIIICQNSELPTSGEDSTHSPERGQSTEIIIIPLTKSDTKT